MSAATQHSGDRIRTPREVLDAIISSTESSVTPDDPIHRQISRVEHLSTDDLKRSVSLAALKLISVTEDWETALAREKWKTQQDIEDLREDRSTMMSVQDHVHLKDQICVLVLRRWAMVKRIEQLGGPGAADGWASGEGVPTRL